MSEVFFLKCVIQIPIININPFIWWFISVLRLYQHSIPPGPKGKGRHVEIENSEINDSGNEDFEVKALNVKTESKDPENQKSESEASDDKNFER